MDTEKIKLRYTLDFVNDLNFIIDYISLTLQNPDAAQKLVNDVQSAILKRAECPSAFEPYHSRIALSCTWYRIYVRNYTVFYVIEDNVMEVRRILYNRRDWTSTL